MPKFVLINKNIITDELRGGQLEAPFSGENYILRVNSKNEKHLDKYIKYTQDEILALNKDKDNDSTIEHFDSDNRRFVRLALTKRGWSFLAHFIEAETSVLDSIYCEDDNGNVETQHYAKFYDENGVELTEQIDIDMNCVKSVFTIIPGIDYEIVCGEIHQYKRPTTNIRLHTRIGAFLPDGVPITSTTFVKNLNLKFKDTNKAIITDGRSPKLLRKDYAGLPVDANQLQFVVTHEPGVKHQMMFEIEYYRE
jgi:hypothetical protein